jgi:hypothetical protein
MEYGKFYYVQLLPYSTQDERNRSCVSRPTELHFTLYIYTYTRSAKAVGLYVISSLWVVGSLVCVMIRDLHIHDDL